MRILIDLRCLQAPPPHGGVGVYAEAITRALLAHDRANEYLLFANGFIHPRAHLPLLGAPNARWVIGHLPNRALNTASAFHIPHSTFHIPDVVFLPNLNFLPPLARRTTLVVTVHDLSFVHFPDLFTVKQRIWHRMVRPRALLARADAIVAVSETTKRDLVETYGIPDGKIPVVYPGIAHVECADSHSPFRIPHTAFPFVLSLAESSPRKNTDGLIAAFAQLPPPHHLVLAGTRGSAARAIARQIVRSPARDRIHLLGPVSEQQKCALLARASCFVYPSIWEGFGFPPLEAMAAGVPVVASTGGALPEILGDAALLVDPLDPSAIARAIRAALTDDALRSARIARGRTRAAEFSWARAGVQLHAILTR